MIDTGSTLSAMSKEAKQLFVKSKGETTHTPVTLGDGTTRNLTKVYQVTLTLNDKMKKIKLYEITGLPFPLLLGTDVAREFGLQLHFQPEKTLHKSQQLFSIQQPDKNDVILSENEKQNFENLKEKYDGILAKSTEELTQTTLMTHHIHTTTDHPIRQQPYRLSPKQKEILEEEIQTLLKIGVIIRSPESPWASPVVMVPKPDGSTRVCIDYRKLNEITKKDAHPLPKIEELLDHLNGAKIFSTMDLLSGFHQIPLDEKAKEKTAFTTHLGLFQFEVMPFGLCNAPATFQRLVEKIFRDILWKFVMLYIDDMIIFSKTIKEHMEHLREVFTILENSHLKAKLKKCTFFQSQLKFLGHTVNEQGIYPLKENVQTVLKLETPTNLKELRSFLGMTSYYRKFIEDYSTKAKPLTQLLKKDEKFEITPNREQAINILKTALSEAPVLRYPDYDKTFLVVTDASKEKIGHAIMQKYGKKHHPIRYGGRQLNQAEQNYTISEKEALALVHAIKKNHPYLHGRRFEVYTDHLPLKTMMNAQDPTGRLARWFLILQRYDFNLNYLPGKDNKVADAISRLNSNQENEPRLEVNLFIQPSKELQNATKVDDELQKAILEDKTGKLIKDEGIIYYYGKQGRRVYLPQSARQDVIKHMHDSPLGCHFGNQCDTEKNQRTILLAKYE